MTCLSFDAAFWKIFYAAGSRIWVFGNSCLGHSRWSKNLHLIYTLLFPMPFLTWKGMDMDCRKNSRRQRFFSITITVLGES